MHGGFGFSPAIMFGGTTTAVYSVAVGLAHCENRVHLLTTNRFDKCHKRFPCTCTHKIELDVTVTFLDTFCIPLWLGFIGLPVVDGLSRICQLQEKVGSKVKTRHLVSGILRKCEF